jgi:predicted amidohydrolase YtcJ
MEEKLGSIEPGKLADLAVLSDDYFAVPDDQVRRIRSVMTVVDGKIVHDAGVLK